jgi:hypothetical protein
MVTGLGFKSGIQAPFALLVLREVILPKQSQDRPPAWCRTPRVGWTVKRPGGRLAVGAHYFLVVWGRN